MKIYIACDHAGFELKEKIKVFLTNAKHDVFDYGAEKLNADDDYPDFVLPLAHAIAKDTKTRGIIFGGSGQGEAMAANRIAGARAAVLCHYDEKIIMLAREHNDANILSIGARFLHDDEAKKAVALFLEIEFSKDERHARRLKKF